jgi:ketosteroid isomerase-like protein
MGWEVMIKKIGLYLAAAAFLGISSGAAIAQDAEDDAADVWATIEGQWNAAEKSDDDALDDYLAEKFMGWGKNSPAPRSKRSTRMWDKFNDTQGRTLKHELYPLSIVVHDDVAVAHYLYTVAGEDADDEVEVNNGRYTDVLIRTEDGWKFLAWHGGDDD